MRLSNWFAVRPQDEFLREKFSWKSLAIMKPLFVATHPSIDPRWRLSRLSGALFSHALLNRKRGLDDAAELID